MGIKRPFGTAYSVGEALEAVSQLGDVYHRELFGWLITHAYSHGAKLYAIRELAMAERLPISGGYVGIPHDDILEILDGDILKTLDGGG